MSRSWLERRLVLIVRYYKSDLLLQLLRVAFVCCCHVRLSFTTLDTKPTSLRLPNQSSKPAQQLLPILAPALLSPSPLPSHYINYLSLSPRSCSSVNFSSHYFNYFFDFFLTIMTSVASASGGARGGGKKPNQFFAAGGNKQSSLWLYETRSAKSVILKWRKCFAELLSIP